MKRILAAIDGSQVASHALDFAITRAKLHDATLEIVYAVNRIAVAMASANPYGAGTDVLPLLDALDEEANSILTSAEQRAKAAGVRIERAQLDGQPAAAILDHVKSGGVDVVVMGTHGRRGLERFAVGSTAEGVLRGSTVPVFIVPQRADAAPITALERAIVAIDGSPASDEALMFASSVAEVEHTHLVLCTVIESPGPHGDELDSSALLNDEKAGAAAELLQRSLLKAQGQRIDAEAVQLRGQADAQIVGLAASTNADCIFTGTHGRAGIPRFLLGSVAEGILRSSTVPVCAIRHR